MTDAISNKIVSIGHQPCGNLPVNHASWDITCILHEHGLIIYEGMKIIIFDPVDLVTAVGEVTDVGYSI